MENNQLYHHGIKGMKWGVRRSEAQLARARGKKSEEVHEDYSKAHDGKSVKSMSDAELRARNNRLQMERQYESMTKKTNRGKQVVTAFIATGALAGGIVTAVDQYKKFGKMAKPAADKAVDKIGNVLVKNIKLDKLTD